ncbi:hypothetical protein I5Q83_18085 [Enterocloster clostridioformis]|uniref:hypothetical protein n=1 Tax=Enterocloster clostridioformis TaxID=1531 RepID=UPI0012F4A9B8|nr:hypothetical protein [Enterocloster clostridioformis]QQQ98129.1 hypothetical protein I5Q83_18085 [Enterocloster clostridioformis]
MEKSMKIYQIIWAEGDDKKEKQVIMHIYIRSNIKNNLKLHYHGATKWFFYGKNG